VISKENVPLIERQNAILTYPAEGDAVLGGENPLSTAAVLGGQDKYLLAQIFDLFNATAKKLRQKHFFWMPITESVVVTGDLRRSPLDDLAIRVQQYDPETNSYWWQFAGYLKHHGALYLPHEASYDPARCHKVLRTVARQALIERAKKMISEKQGN
jgi:hypothetical protein